MISTGCMLGLTLFGLGAGRRGEGGGQKVPALTVNVNCFFNIEANASKLGDFSFNLSGNNLVWHTLVKAI